MRQGEEKGCSRRERLEVTATALVPAALGLLAPAVMLAGRLSWLGPLLALPVGLCLCPVWGWLGRTDLSRGLEEAFGRIGGKLAETFYFLWALALLTDAARGYSGRLLATISEGEGARWLLLLSALGLCLWLGRGKAGAFARTGRLFFLVVAVTLGAILLLALPGVDWQNLWPPEEADWRELPGSAALCLSLAGYGVYALCLPCREGEGMRKTWPWAALGCGGLAALLLVTVGVFGPALTVELREPFLYLLEGVQVPGAFRRGEAALAAILALGDLMLLALLSRGAVTLWRGLVPVFPDLGWVPVGGAFLLAGVLPGLGQAQGRLWASLPAGNLILGVLLPAVSVLTIQARERRKKQAIFCGEKLERKEDVAVKWAGKKSSGENEKKC